MIVAVDGKRLTRTHDLTDIVSTYGAGDKVTLTSCATASAATVKVELGRAPAAAPAAEPLAFVLGMLRAWRRRGTWLTVATSR